jgi:hypothetical protein
MLTTMLASAGHRAPIRPADPARETGRAAAAMAATVAAAAATAAGLHRPTGPAAGPSNGRRRRRRRQRRRRRRRRRRRCPVAAARPRGAASCPPVRPPARLRRRRRRRRRQRLRLRRRRCECVLAGMGERDLPSIHASSCKIAHRRALLSAIWSFLASSFRPETCLAFSSLAWRSRTDMVRDCGRPYCHMCTVSTNKLLPPCCVPGRSACPWRKQLEPFDAPMSLEL